MAGTVRRRASQPATLFDAQGDMFGHFMGGAVAGNNIKPELSAWIRS